MSLSTMQDINSVYSDASLMKWSSQFMTLGPTAFVPTYRTDAYPAIDSSKADMSGKRVFITGATHGIGRATAISYAKAGVSVIALGARSSFGSIEEEIHKAALTAAKPYPKVITYELDVTDRQSVESAAQDFSSRFDSLDILVNNAGYLSVWDYTHKSDPDDWWRGWEVNVKGAWLVARCFIPLLIKSELKTLVSMASIGSVMVAPGGTSYNLTKAVNVRMAEVWEAEYREEGLLSFSFQPGNTVTELSSRLPGQASSLGQDKPELGGETLVFLTKERLEWLNGRFTMANWDMTEFIAKKDEVINRDLFKLRMTK